MCQSIIQKMLMRSFAMDVSIQYSENDKIASEKPHVKLGNLLALSLLLVYLVYFDNFMYSLA